MNAPTEVPEKKDSSAKTATDEKPLEDESKDRTVAETTQNPEDIIVTMTTQKTVEDVTTEIDIEETTRQEPIENMTEITATAGVMQDTEEATTSMPIQPEISEEEKEISEEDILVSIETTTLSA